MCEAKVYLEKDEQEHLIMENVTLMQPEGEEYLLVNLLGEQKLIQGQIERIDFLKHAIYLSDSPQSATEES